MTEPTRRRLRWRAWLLGVASGVLAIAAIVVGSQYGYTTTSAHRLNVIGWSCAGALLVFGMLAVTRISKLLAHHVSETTVPTAGGAVRIISAGVGYLIVVFLVLAQLHVSIEKLLVGAGLAGVVLGIAAQQTLGNVFAGLVLIFAKPFRIGDRVRVRSGALGGIFDARVREMSLTYVTLQSEDGSWKIPNSAMLAAGVLRTPRTPLPPPAGTAAPTTQGPAQAPASGPAPTAGRPPADRAPTDGAAGVGAAPDRTADEVAGGGRSPTGVPAAAGRATGGTPAPE